MAFSTYNDRLNNYKAVLQRQGAEILEGVASLQEAVHGFNRVEKVPAFFQVGAEPVVGPDGVSERPEFVDAPENFLTISIPPSGDKRNAEVLGAVGSKYTVVQDEDAFAGAGALVEGGNAEFFARGDFGARRWLMLRFNGTIDVAGYDEMHTFLQFDQAHDGTGSNRGRLWLLRDVCLNGQVFTGMGIGYTIRHTASVHDKIAKANRLLEQAGDNLSDIQEVFNQMTQVQLTREQRANYVANVLGIDLTANISSRTENILEQIARILESGRGASGHEQTKYTPWGVYNAMTEYLNHHRSTKGGEQNRLKSLMFGDSARKASKAFDLARELTLAA